MGSETTNNTGRGVSEVLSLSKKKSSSFRLRCSSLNSLRLRRVFDLFDRNSDGIVTAEEISKALVLLGLEADRSDPALDSIINSFVKPGNLGLTFDDFQSLHRSLDESTLFDRGDAEVIIDDDIMSSSPVVVHDQLLDNIADRDEENVQDLISDQDESDLTEAFKVFDQNGDGYISARELQSVLDKLGLPEAREMDRVQRMISSVDRNDDGLVDFFEFKDMMRSVLVHSS